MPANIPCADCVNLVGAGPSLRLHPHLTGVRDRLQTL